MRRLSIAPLALASLAVSALACSEASEAPRAPVPAASTSAPEPAPTPEPATAEPKVEAVEEPADPAALANRGRGVYNGNCIACHSADPAKDGALGPAVAGASAELLEARVLRGEYPPGYTPKRETKAMIPLPHLAGDIDALAAFLATGEAG